jgi:hypothetical protein
LPVSRRAGFPFDIGPNPGSDFAVEKKQAFE